MSAVLHELEAARRHLDLALDVPPEKWSASYDWHECAIMRASLDEIVESERRRAAKDNPTNPQKAMFLKHPSLRCAADCIGVPLHQVERNGKSYIVRALTYQDAESVVTDHLAGLVDIAKEQTEELL